MITYIGGRKCKVNASFKNINYYNLFKLTITITGNRYNNDNVGERFAFSLILPRNIEKIKQYIEASIYLNDDMIFHSCNKLHMKNFLLKNKDTITHLAIKSYIYGIKKYGM